MIFLFTKIEMINICLAELMKWNRMGEALHDRIEEARVAPIFHSECDTLFLMIDSFSDH